MPVASRCVAPLAVALPHSVTLALLTGSSRLALAFQLPPSADWKRLRKVPPTQTWARAAGAAGAEARAGAGVLGVTLRGLR